jgi:hypothetical protein
VATLQAEMNRLHAAAQQRVDAISDKYDADTKHGHNASQQAAWAARIQGWYTSKKLTWG